MPLALHATRTWSLRFIKICTVIQQHAHNLALSLSAGMHQHRPGLLHMQRQSERRQGQTDSWTTNRQIPLILCQDLPLPQAACEQCPDVPHGSPSSVLCCHTAHAGSEVNNHSCPRHVRVGDCESTASCRYVFAPSASSTRTRSLSPLSLAAINAVFPLSS